LASEERLRFVTSDNKSFADVTVSSSLIPLRRDLPETIEFGNVELGDVVTFQNPTSSPVQWSIGAVSYEREW
jgi:hypothetical protein